jgi:5-methylcytosine-specific restriction endonuclease McrBC regulatory subunit McrC
MNQSENIIRLCEWGRVRLPELSTTQRFAILEASRRWADEARLSALPLEFGGADGSILSARQYVGVVSVAGCSIEIYPKLDAELVDRDEFGDTSDASTVMSSLLRLLSVSGYLGFTEADAAHLASAPLTYDDLYAYLYGKHLYEELRCGVAHSYEERSDDLRTVRGRIDLSSQVRRFQDRFDKIVCEWDDFTSDNPFNRLLKCACQVMHGRTRHGRVARLLEDCCSLLADVADVVPREAVTAAASTRWSRSNERFRRVYGMAMRALNGSSVQFASGGDDTFVFLVDMNEVFEAYVGAVLEQALGVPVEQQACIGHLITGPRQRIRQLPDYRWCIEGQTWIGDAKYKRLLRMGSRGAPQAATAEIGDEDGARSPNQLSPDDLRQLTVYAEIERRRLGQDAAMDVVLFCPFVGAGDPLSQVFATWNGGRLALVPVHVDRDTPFNDDALRILMVRHGVSTFDLLSYA